MISLFPSWPVISLLAVCTLLLMKPSGGLRGEQDTPLIALYTFGHSVDVHLSLSPAETPLTLPAIPQRGGFLDPPSLFTSYLQTFGHVSATLI